MRFAMLKYCPRLSLALDYYYKNNSLVALGVL